MSGPGRRLLLEQVAERTATLPMRVWGFGEGPALSGLVAASDVLGRPDLLERATELVRPSLGAPPGPEDHLIAVEVLRHLADRVPDLGVDAAEKRWQDAVRLAKRPVDGRPPVHRDDLLGLGRLIWVDCLHTDGPGLVLLGADPEPAVEECAAVLQDDDGLFHHGYDVVDGVPNGVRWGRGQGWALWGLVAAQAGRPSRTLADRLGRLIEGLARYEREGRWRTIVDAPGAPVEHSVSALVAAGVLAGVDTGVLPAETAALGERALDAACADVDDGALPVSEATPVGSPVTYLSRRVGVFPWGQGPLLLALAIAEGWRPFESKERSL